MQHEKFASKRLMLEPRSRLKFAKIIEREMEIIMYPCIQWKDVLVERVDVTVHLIVDHIKIKQTSTCTHLTK